MNRKSKVTAALLCLFLGPLGAHRFYVRKIGTGCLMIIATLFGIGFIWWVIDLLTIVFGRFEDVDGKAVM